MKKRSPIVSIGGADDSPHDQAAPAPAPAFVAAEEEAIEDEEAISGGRSLREWVLPTVFLTAIAGWTALFAWVHSEQIAAWPAVETWIGWLGQWTPPVVLVCAAWLLSLRNSRREAGRFHSAAHHLSVESRRLEARIATINRELSLAREFLAAQGRELESLGRMATERLSGSAEQLQSLIAVNSGQVETIGSVSEAALDNMERLRGQLPVIASAAKDVASNIGNVGRTAQSHLQEMVAGFNTLNDFGQASERQVQALAARVDAVVEEFQRQARQLDEIAYARFAALAEKGAEFRSQLDGHEVEALASVRTRARALSEEIDLVRAALDEHEAESLTSLRARLTAVRDESGVITRALREAEAVALAGWAGQLERMQTDVHTAIAALESTDIKAIDAARARFAALAEETERLDQKIAERNRLFADEMDRRHAEAEQREEDAMASLRLRVGQLDTEIAARRAGHVEQTAAIVAHGEAVIRQMEQLAERLATAAEQGKAVEHSLSANLEVFAGRLAASRQALDTTYEQVSVLTEASVRLLELIRASADHGRVDLPAALSDAERSLVSVEKRLETMRAGVGDARANGEDLNAAVANANEGLAKARAEISRLHEIIAQHSTEHGQTLDGLALRLARIGEETTGIAEKSQSALTAAIVQLQGAASEAVASIDRDSAQAITQVATRLGEESGAVLDKVMRMRAAETVGQLEQAAAHAAGVSREAALQLRDQLAKVNELAGNLEARVAQARSKAQEQVDNAFARRAALITDSLNSNAIDIAKALSSDVADTAWAAYLRGDRGIFTRRAVSLLDNSEARAISHIYEHDLEFRDHVSRYIHDFEGMLRQLLSTRDGHALGVTLLSSDMGKLYVALAQAIERLRK